MVLVDVVVAVLPPALGMKCSGRAVVYLSCSIANDELIVRDGTTQIHHRPAAAFHAERRGQYRNHHINQHHQ